ncbi:MOSC N-terminal beta barrel domain-containing protein [Leptolyngbya sp. FACHB-541]|uniref:MOSC domain-containing protein n=1 Tax=Leptolyngbya sp. FACHB-541 TaxID=2692810 RepID=UPI001686DC7F|nr:MOSC N-terminal beta barrel domain-containing protein [Leptolyngbya sp. FACHB-541]MBD1998613.1 MOSC N-terminal beta barrel domain-containing protein [Leptolyngbya sp. FACHB-541]
MPYLKHITIFPIKSLDGLEMTQATFLKGGAIAHDREFAIVDQHGEFVNGKRTDKIHRLRSVFDLPARMVTMTNQDSAQSQKFHLDDERQALSAWLSDFFGYTVELKQDLHMGFPDDPDASGPTVVSTATLEAITSWFPELSLEEVRRRFRTNLEIDDVPAFWEDQLFGEAGQLVPFQIGDVVLNGSNPCQRCVVPTRDSLKGDRYPNFQKTFITKRQGTLPEWAVPQRFNHFFKLTVNTRVAASEAGKTIKLGDEVKLSSTFSLPGSI